MLGAVQSTVWARYVGIVFADNQGDRLEDGSNEYEDITLGMSSTYSLLNN